MASNSERDVYYIHSIIPQHGKINGKDWRNTCFVCIDDSNGGYLVRTFKGVKGLEESIYDESERYRLLFDSSGRVCEFVTVD